MSAEFFLDTNILIYSFDEREPAKRARATELVERALYTGEGLISYQVVQEFLNLAMRRFTPPMTPQAAVRYVDLVLEPLCAVFPGLSLYRHAVSLHERWHFSFYDSLVVAAALQAGCKTLYSEDLQQQQSIEGLTVVDPFRPA